MQRLMLYLLKKCFAAFTFKQRCEAVQDASSKQDMTLIKKQDENRLCKTFQDMSHR